MEYVRLMFSNAFFLGRNIIKESFNFSRFEVPKKSGVGYCGASILKLYFDSLDSDLKTNIIRGPVFYRGTKGPTSKAKRSKFTNEVISKRTLSTG